MVSPARETFRIFARSFVLMSVALSVAFWMAPMILRMPLHPGWHTLLVSAGFTALASRAVLAAAQGRDGEARLTHMLALRRNVVSLAAGMAVLALAEAVTRLVLDDVAAADMVPAPRDVVRLLGIGLVQFGLALSVLSWMTRPARLVRTLARQSYRDSAAASRASAVIPAQSPLAIFPFGATQLPPTQRMFGNDR